MIYEPRRDLWSKIARKRVAWTRTRPIDMAFDRARVTFSFDDAPRSAATIGAPILEEFAARGVFYISGGLVGGVDHCGPSCLPEDIQALDARGHEIGCHTYTHMDCARADLTDVEADLQRNLVFLRTLDLSHPVQAFAYPYGETTLALKRGLSHRYATCRGIAPGLNATGADHAQLRANALYGDDATIAKALIDRAIARRAWLIFFTHDVGETPSPFGCTPAMLRATAQHARNVGAEICTMRGVSAYIQRGSDTCAR